MKPFFVVFVAVSVTAITNYSQMENWGCLPSKEDRCDYGPNSDRQRLSSIDVFYVHPTTFADEAYESGNLPIAQERINPGNQDVFSVQASVFIGGAKVYAPYYEQAHLYAFFDQEDGPAFLQHAYDDIDAAFQYYLTHLNQGRPFILSGHSQGGYMITSLLRDYFTGISESAVELRSRLLSAYIIGEFVGEDTFFGFIPACESANDTACFISFSTVAYGSNPVLSCGAALSPCANYTVNTENPVCVNPLSFSTSTLSVNASFNPGSWLPEGEVTPGLVGGECSEGILLVDDENIQDYPNQNGDYHESDFLLYYQSLYNHVRLKEMENRSSSSSLDCPVFFLLLGFLISIFI